MKARCNMVILSGLVWLASTTQSQALPPRPRIVSGVIASVDHEAHTITLKADKGDKPLVFVWNNHTRFLQGWSRICLDALDPGQAVKISYRREIGQLVSREVNLRKEAVTRCAARKCCRRRS